MVSPTGPSAASVDTTPTAPCAALSPLIARPRAPTAAASCSILPTSSPATNRISRSTDCRVDSEPAQLRNDSLTDRIDDDIACPAGAASRNREMIPARTFFVMFHHLAISSPAAVKNACSSPLARRTSSQLAIISAPPRTASANRATRGDAAAEMLISPDTRGPVAADSERAAEVLLSRMVLSCSRNRLVLDSSPTVSAAEPIWVPMSRNACVTSGASPRIDSIPRATEGNTVSWAMSLSRSRVETSISATCRPAGVRRDNASW